MPRLLSQSPATAETAPSCAAGRKAGPLLSVLPLLVLPGLWLFGIASGAGHPGLRQAVLRDARQDAPLPTAPQAERAAYTCELYREDLRTFQAKIDRWQAAARAPGAAGRRAQLKQAQWQRLARQTRATLQKQAREAALP